MDTDVEKVKINGVEYVKAGTQLPPQDRDIRICILHRGRVVVGEYSREGQYVTLTNCSCVRRWGTTAGLGEIAAGGPTTKTVLDKQPETTVHELAVVETIQCDCTKW